MSVKLLSIVGMSGAGKSTVIEHLGQQGLPRVYFGGLLYAEMDRRGIEKTPENQVWFRQALREERGEACLAELAIEEARRLVAAGQKRIVLDGVHYLSEYRAMKHAFPGEMEQVALLADLAVRHARLAKRPERPLTAEQATERDRSEIETQGIGNTIMLSEYFILNNGGTEELFGAMDRLLHRIRFWDYQAIH